jgi:integrase
MADEVFTLEWRQVDREAGEVRLHPGTTKTGHGRVVYFSPELKALFDAQWQEHERLKKEGRIVPHVFHRNGRAIKSIRIAWQNACRDAGCPGRIPHDFRRTAARNLVRLGLSETVAMGITGHKTRSVFERYNVRSDRDLRAAALVMDGALPGASKASCYTLATLAGQQGRRTKRSARVS